MIQSDRMRGFFDEPLETMTPELRRARQRSLIRKLLDYVSERSTAYRRKFARAGVDPRAVVEFEDLPSLPLTRRGEIIESLKAEPPFGGFCCLRPEEIRTVFVSPGPMFHPVADYEAEGRLRARAAYACGLRPGDMVLVTFAFNMVPAGYRSELTLRSLGCATIPSGPGNTDVQVDILKGLPVKGYIGTPSFLNAIGKRAVERGLYPRRDFRLEAAQCTAEMLPESLRADLQEQFGMTVRQTFAIADAGLVAYECPAARGMHLVDEVIIEICDVGTGRHVPPGEVGEIVVSVFRPDMPMVRFATGDLTYVTEEQCPCGRTAPRLVRIVGRADQVTKVRGMFVHPAEVDGVMARFPGIKGWRMTVTREGHQDQLTCTVEVEGEAEEGFASRLTEALRDRIKVRADVRIVPPDTIPPGAKKIEDRRVWE